MEAFGPISLTAVTSTGNVSQLYPAWVTAGDALPFTSNGNLRRPEGGRVGQISVETDSTNGGTVQIFDIDGLMGGADVSSDVVITNTQLTTLINAGKAKKIWEQNFAASPGAPIVWAWSQGFMKGLAARFVGGAGTINLNIIGEGGYSTRYVPGPYRAG